MKSSFPQSLNRSDFKWVFCGPSVCVSLLFTLCLDPKLTFIMCFRGFLVTRLGCILQQIPGGGGGMYERWTSQYHIKCVYFFSQFFACLGPLLNFQNFFFLRIWRYCFSGFYRIVLLMKKIWCQLNSYSLVGGFFFLFEIFLDLLFIVTVLILHKQKD